MDLALLTEAFESDATPLVRTDFTSDSAWQRVLAEVSQPVEVTDLDHEDLGEGGATADIVEVADRGFAGVSGADLAAALSETTSTYGYVLLADARSMTEVLAGGEVTLAYVDLSVTGPEDAELFNSFPGRTFRCIVPEIAAIEVNLSISNMGFSDFADNTDPDGVFRGFGDGQ